MFRADGSPMPHDECYMVDVLRTGISVRQQEIQVERPDGLRGIALVDIEAIKDNDGNIIGAVNCFQDVTERKRALEREQMLAREVDHRAKNLLALVQAAVQLTKADSAEDFKAAIGGRLQALSNAHSLIAQSRWAGADLRTLVTEELAPYKIVGGTRISIAGPSLVLEPKSAQSLAMILHELITNAVKHGSLSVSSGRLLVEWSRSETELVIRWSESGGPPVTAPNRQGFGTRMLGPVVQMSLRGRYQVDWDPGGLRCEMFIPLDHVLPNHQ